MERRRHMGKGAGKIRGELEERNYALGILLALAASQLLAACGLCNECCCCWGRAIGGFVFCFLKTENPNWPFMMPKSQERL
jgi:hypothetical protein